MKLTPLLLATSLASLASAQLRDPVTNPMQGPYPEAITLTINLATPPATPLPTSTTTVIVHSKLEKCCLWAPGFKDDCDPNPECFFGYAQNVDNPYWDPAWKPAPPPVGDAVKDDGQKRAVDLEGETKPRTRDLDSKTLRRGLVDDMQMKEKCKGLWKSDKTKHRDACAKEVSGGQNTCMLKSLLDDASEECKAAMVKAMGFNH